MCLFVYMSTCVHVSAEARKEGQIPGAGVTRV